MNAAALQLTQRATCPGCDAAVGRTVYSVPFAEPPLRDYLTEFYGGRLDVDALADASYELVDCSSCGLLYQRSRPDDVSLPAFYASVVEADRCDVETRRGDSVRRAAALDVRRTIARCRRPASDVAILDYGAGTGMWVDCAAAVGTETWVCELDPVAADRLAAAGHQVVHPDHLPSERFDFVNAEQVLEHVAEPLRVVERLARSLRPGGYLRLSVPNGSGVRALLEHPDWSAPKSSATSLNAVAPLEHLNCFDHNALAGIGQRGGLTLVQFPLRTEFSAATSVRSIVAALSRRLRPPAGTLLYFQRRS
ncbi:MAG: class I SAM-dependent methyltransferase [Actinomycetes bacterium]